MARTNERTSGFYNLAFERLQAPHPGSHESLQQHDTAIGASELQATITWFEAIISITNAETVDEFLAGLQMLIGKGDPNKYLEIVLEVTNGSSSLSDSDQTHIRALLHKHNIGDKQLEFYWRLHFVLDEYTEIIGYTSKIYHSFDALAGDFLDGSEKLDEFLDDNDAEVGESIVMLSAAAFRLMATAAVQSREKMLGSFKTPAQITARQSIHS